MEEGEEKEEMEQERVLGRYENLSGPQISLSMDDERKRRVCGSFLYVRSLARAVNNMSILAAFRCVDTRLPPFAVLPLFFPVLTRPFHRLGYDTEMVSFRNGT